MVEHRHHEHHVPSDLPQAHAHFDDPGEAARLEREGEVLLELFDRAVATLRSRASAAGLAVRCVLDIGCGPGVAACLLAERFPGARIVAADGSAAMVGRATARAARRGVSPRVEARVVPLPDGIDTLGRPDVIWASMVLHHVADELDALRRLRSLLAPGGLLVLLERDRPARVVPEGVELGRPGLWERLDAALEGWFADMRRALAADDAAAATATSTTAPGVMRTWDIIIFSPAQVAI